MAVNVQKTRTPNFSRIIIADLRISHGYPGAVGDIIGVVLEILQETIATGPFVRCAMVHGWREDGKMLSAS